MKNKNNVGALKWGKKVMIESGSSAWYDHSYYSVPFVGTLDVSKMRSALSKRYPNTGNYFGGYTTVGDISLLNDGHVKVELIYHIGN
jgi:hypothetical protein